jgi:hypothetical protein
MLTLKQNTIFLGQLTKLHQISIVEDFIASFKKLAIHIEGMMILFSKNVLSMV